MRKWTTAVSLCVFLNASLVWAQESLYSMADVVARVVERDPGVKARQVAREAARSEARRAETLRLPKMYLNTDVGDGRVYNDVANFLQTGLQQSAIRDTRRQGRLADLSSNRPYFVPGARLENLVFDGGKTSATIRSAWLSENKAEVEQGRSREDETFSTASEFLNLALGQVLARYLEDYQQAAELAATALTKQAEAGRITSARALAGQAKLQDALTSLENNRDDLRYSSGLLRERADLPAEAAFDTRPLEARLEAFECTPLPGAPELEKNPLTQSAFLDERMQEQNLRVAKAQRFPELKFEAEYGFAFSALLFSFRPGYTLGVRATYPLFTSGEVERSIRTELRQRDAASLRAEKVRLTVREEYGRYENENRKLARQLEAARSQLTQAQEVYRVARLRYDQGAGAPSELLEAAELLFASRQRALELARSGLLIRWEALRLQSKLLAEVQRGALP